MLPTPPRGASAAAEPEPTERTPRRDPAPEPPPRYSLLAEVAREGIGRVFVASDEELGRLVAVKQVLSPSRETLARFEREARLLARLQHASIVPVYELGKSSDGEPFLVTRKIEGHTLGELCARAGSLGERLALLPHVIAAAEAVAYAHGEGVVHGDLKPGNVLVTGHGETLVTEWGQAQGPAPGRVLSTPQFMAPEQLEGGAADPRADVYALGAILYTVLGGHEPFTGERGSALLARVKRSAPLPLLHWAPELPGALVAIVDEAMARLPDERLGSVAALARALRGYLAARLAPERRLSRAARVRRWVGAHRALVLAGLAAAGALGGAGGLLLRDLIVERNQALAARQAALARENALVLMQAERSLIDEPTAALAWIKRFRPSAGEAWLARAVAEEAVARGVARHVFRFPVLTRAMAVAPRASLLIIGDEAGGIHRIDLESGARREIGRHAGPITALGVAPDERKFASLDASGRLRLWSLEGSALDATGLHASVAGKLAFSPDGTRLAVTQGRNVVTLFSTSELVERLRLSFSSRVTGFAFCAPTGALVVMENDGRAVVLAEDATAPRRLAGRHEDARVFCLPGGAGFVTAGVDGEVRVWDAARGQPRTLNRHADWVSTVAISPDGQLIASGGGDDQVGLAGLAPGAGARLLGGHEDTIRGLAFSADGGLLVSASFGLVRLWDPRVGTPVRSYRSTGGPATFWALADGGRTLVASAPFETRVWSTESPRSVLHAAHGGLVTRLTWSDDGTQLASAARDRTVRVTAIASGKHWVSAPLDAWPLGLSFLDQQRLLVVTRSRKTSILTVSNGAETPVLPPSPTGVAGSAFAAMPPARDRLAYIERDTVHVQEIATGQRIELAPRLPHATALEFSRDGAWLVGTSRQGLAALWDSKTGRLARLERLGEGIDEVALSPNRRLAALLARNKRVLLWDLGSGAVREAPAAGAVDGRLAFVDDRRLVYRAAEKTIGVLDVEDTALRTLFGHRSPITAMASSPDRTMLASADASGFVRLWDLTSERTAILLAHEGAVHPLAFSPDGARLASAGPNGEIRVVEIASLPLTTAIANDPSWIARSSSAVVSAGGDLHTP